ncbi:MAG TPA: hypothetical protein VKP65_07745, partial [Rhodothermales bacterium]|nr:hypothetical protein [Rhodothermales bacterium]
MLRAFFALMIGFACVQNASAQFGDCATTGADNSIFIIQDATVNGSSLASGSKIALYNAGGDRCGGFAVWENSTLSLTVWEDDGSNEGLQVGESLQFKVWDDGTIYDGN